jgi:hypothetical protein
MNEDCAEDEPWAIFERSSPGWFRVTLPGVGAEARDVEVFLGGAIGADGKPLISGLALLGDQISPGDLRRIPLGRLQAALSASHRREWLTTTGSQPHPLRELQDVADEGPDQLFRRDDLRPRLTRPDGADPPSFYGQVADAYRQYVQHSNKPAVEIAGEAGVPVATARRWINHARELGLLEKGQRGRAI